VLHCFTQLPGQAAELLPLEPLEPLDPLPPEVFVFVGKQFALELPLLPALALAPL